MNKFFYFCLNKVIFKIHTLFMCIYMFVGVFPFRPEDGIPSPGARVRGDCVAPTTGAGKWTKVPRRSSQNFLTTDPSLEYMC